MCGPAGWLSFEEIEDLRAARLDDPESARLMELEQRLASESDRLQGNLESVRGGIARLREASVAEGEAIPLLESRLLVMQTSRDEIVAGISRSRDELRRDRENRERHSGRAIELQTERQRLRVWVQLKALIGSHDGSRFRRYAQGISLEILIHHANKHLGRLTERYKLQRCAGEDLELEIVDRHQAGAQRPMASLSGGECFLASLALALGLADIAGRNARIDSLFIDEGFGALDGDTLDVAISALETLRQENKTVGVISHVELLKERIATQIVVEKKSGGMSSIGTVS